MRSTWCALVLVSAVVSGCDKKEPPRAPDSGRSGASGAAGGDRTGAQGDAAIEPEPADVEGEGAAPDEGEAETRTPVVDRGHELYTRFEAPDVDNACTTDADCKRGGCGGEVCSAAADVVTTCELLPVQLPPDAACGCVDGTCQWWSRSGAGLSGTSTSTRRPEPRGDQAPERDVVRCGAETCKPGQVCIEYYGVAGPKGPKFQSCEWACGKGGGDCPPGTTCVTIADGPGAVCR